MLKKFVHKVSQVGIKSIKLSLSNFSSFKEWTHILLIIWTLQTMNRKKNCCSLCATSFHHWLSRLFLPAGIFTVFLVYFDISRQHLQNIKNAATCSWKNTKLEIPVATIQKNPIAKNGYATWSCAMSCTPVHHMHMKSHHMNSLIDIYTIRFLHHKHTEKNSDLSPNCH